MKLEQRVAKLEADRALLIKRMNQTWKNALIAGRPDPFNKSRVPRLEDMLAALMRGLRLTAQDLEANP